MLKLFQILGDRHAGFILCMIVIANIIFGSLVMNSYPELYPAFFPLDLKRFFQPVMLVHTWLYLLLATFTLFGINLLACLVNSINRIINVRAGRLKATAALLFHTALLITMLAHLYEGLYASSGQAMISQQPVALPGIGSVRMESMDIIYHPDETQKDAEVVLLFDRLDGQHVRKEIAFNEPAIFDGGRRQVVMLTSQSRPAGVIVHSDSGNRSYEFMPQKPLSIGTGQMALHGLLEDSKGTLYGQFLWRAENSELQQFYMALDNNLPQQSQFSIEGTTYRFKGMAEAPFIAAIIRHNPAVPLIIASLILASMAVILLTAWLRSRNKSRYVREG